MKFTPARVVNGDDSSSGRKFRSGFDPVSAPDTWEFWELRLDNFCLFPGTLAWRTSPNRFGCEKQNNIYSAQRKITADDFLRGLPICVSGLQGEEAVVFRNGIGGRAGAWREDGEESVVRVSGGARNGVGVGVGVGVWDGVGAEVGEVGVWDGVGTEVGTVFLDFTL